MGQRPTETDYFALLRSWASALSRCRELTLASDLKVALEMLRHVSQSLFLASGNLCTHIQAPTLADLTGVPLRSVQRARARLCRLGMMERVGGRKDAVYVFLPAWLAGSDPGAPSRRGRRTDSAAAPRHSRGANRKIDPATAVASTRDSTPPRLDRSPRHSCGARTGVYKYPPLTPPSAQPDLFADPVRERLKRHFGTAVFDAWFGRCELVVVDDTALIEAPDRFHADRISDVYEDGIRLALGVRAIEVAVFRRAPAAGGALPVEGRA